MSYVGRTVEYRLDITVLKFLDETSGLYAFIIKSHSGKFKSKSSVNATFRVEKTCPQRPQPTTASVTNKVKGDSHEDHTSDPKEPSTATAPPNDDSTSTVCIPAEPTISVCVWVLIAIAVIAVIGGILVICFCIRRHLQMGKRNQSNGTTDFPMYIV